MSISPSDSHAKSLQELPEELQQAIIEYLPREALVALSRASKWAYLVASPLLWREVDLVDCKRWRGVDDIDTHDDTPLIKKLIVLASNPQIAFHVQVLNHRCHLPPPSIFNELPRATFASQDLSSDPRTTRLVVLAARNLVRVHTLRIIFGHPSLNDALLRCLFDKNRTAESPIRRLWLENCRMSAGCNMHLSSHPYRLPLELDFRGLESVRLRRMPVRPGVPLEMRSSAHDYIYSRGGGHAETADLQDGQGGLYETLTTVGHYFLDEILDHARDALLSSFQFGFDQTVPEQPQQPEVPPVELLFAVANILDDQIYAELASICTPAERALFEEASVQPHPRRSELAFRGCFQDPINIDQAGSIPYKASQRERIPSSIVMNQLLESCRNTLTSINLDWLLSRPQAMGYSRDPDIHIPWIDMFKQFFELRFPHLKALQFRSMVSIDTLLPRGLYLLDYPRLQVWNNRIQAPDDPFPIDEEVSARVGLVCLEFMEAHPNIECLAWPIDRFFSEHALENDIMHRVDAVIENLGRQLVDLRVDANFGGQNEGLSDHGLSEPCIRRRRFITDFATRMKRVRSVKIEGGTPRDEKREIVRALHQSPLERIIMIGVSFPIGNTWGANAIDLPETLPPEEVGSFEGEHKDATWHWAAKPLVPSSSSSYRYVPEWGWAPQPPLLRTIATHHASTIIELKFCGYRGSPVMFGKTPITDPLLSSLKHFHNLTDLAVSFWLTTHFEGASRDKDIIDYWLASRSPSTTALVRVLTEDDIQHLEGWEKELKTKFAPEALATAVAEYLGPFLSEKAMAKAATRSDVGWRRRGMHVRASFCIGDWGGIFDMDVWIGVGNVWLDFEGPREEMEEGRKKEKLETRRWF